MRLRVPRESRLILGSHQWHDSPQPRVEGERPLACAVPFGSAQADHNQRGTARAQQQAQMLRLVLRDSERSGALARATRKPADYACTLLERRTTAGSGRREASRRCSASAWRIGRQQPARYGTRAAASLRDAPPPERQRAQCRARLFHSEAGWFLEAAAGMSHHGRARRRRVASRRCSALT